MRFEECRPGGLTQSVGCRFDSVGLQDIANRGVGDVVSDVGQRTLDAVVAWPDARAVFQGFVL
jgi:hypothetical protein